MGPLSFGGDEVALIEFVCRRHATPHVLGPLVTRVKNAWACCRGHAREDHEWIPIRATPLEDVMWAGPLEELQKR